MKAVSEKIAALFLICILALIITGYTYSHWQDTVNIQTTAKMAKLAIYIQNHNTTLTGQCYQIITH